LRQLAQVMSLPTSTREVAAATADRTLQHF
jgi:hypothetical protein